MPIPINFLLMAMGAIYQALACWLEDRTPPPGQRIDIGGYKLHLCVAEDSNPEHSGDRPTIVVEHSLGGIEGYFLTAELSKLGRVCIYDRAGYGWSDHSPHPRTSEQIVTELDTLLTRAGIEPPYILVGDSFGSYNVRLYAYRFPEKVRGLVLTDGLHESGMLKMSLSLQLLKLFFISGFVMSILGSALGIIRLIMTCRIFEVVKPELRQIPQQPLSAVKRSFCRPKHWITMTREMIDLDRSGRQVKQASTLGALPLVSIKSHSFFKPSVWTVLLPLKGANNLREQMHEQLLRLSTNATQVQAEQSSHFVWVDQIDVLVNAVKVVLEKIKISQI
jgi:pimeloyl-ACP methyl ester carboxylesterase